MPITRLAAFAMLVVAGSLVLSPAHALLRHAAFRQRSRVSRVTLGASPFGSSSSTGSSGGNRFGMRDPAKMLGSARDLASEAAKIVKEVGPGATLRRTLKGQRALLETGLDLLRELPRPGSPGADAASAVALDIPRLLLAGDSASAAKAIERYLAALPKDLAPRTLRKLFERLGATYIKLGQFVASSPTLFPAEYVLEFQKCLDQSPTVEFATIKSIVEADLGVPLGDVFSSFDEVPLASASVAQVRLAFSLCSLAC